MKKWLAKLSFSVVGCDTHTLIEADTYEEAYQQAYEDSIEWAQSFGYEQDDEAFGDLDTVGCDWDEDEQEYAQQGFIDPEVVPYVPEKHDMYLN